MDWHRLGELLRARKRALESADGKVIDLRAYRRKAAALSRRTWWAAFVGRASGEEAPVRPVAVAGCGQLLQFRRQAG